LLFSIIFILSFGVLVSPPPSLSGDRVLQGLLAEVLTAHKGAGGKLLPPVSTSPSAGTGSGSSSSSSGASHEAAAAAEQAEESMSMSNAMSEAGWMGPQDDGEWL